MRDKKDTATFDLPGLSAALTPTDASAGGAPAPKRAVANATARRAGLKQEQLELLEPTDASGLPVWLRDERLDLTGLPVWAPA